MRLSKVLVALALIMVLSAFIVWFVMNSGQSSPTMIKQNVIDISWPNCAIKYAGSNFGIVGVTGGLDFHPNKCLFEETQLFESYSLYMNTGYPGADNKHARSYIHTPKACSSTDNLCHAYNYGYNAATYAIKYSNSQSVHTFTWWLDVESSNSWTDNSLQNRAVLAGMVDSIKNNTFLTNIGYYSYPGQWNNITGHWQNGYPGWVATGTASPTAAKESCSRPGFTNGTIWISQYTTNLDENIVCSDDYFNHLKPAKY
ncbi:MAG TPA: hypothetical protein VLF79_00120 [Candidatus Saccharimonadales bacterium]|nr:hypothetical protein [Candidatus Saccharimonadales bacterium]